jgi:uncharacterized membrane protein YbaN (DUF454 family)
MKNDPKTTPKPDEPAEFPSGNPIAVVTRGTTRILYFVLAGFFFVLGVAGALLPILPATPFLLLTSYFLVRTSPRLNAMLLRSRFFGPILTDWQVHGGVRPDIKAKAVVVVLLAVGLTIYLTGRSLIPTLVVIVLAAIGIGVILFLPKAR